MSGGGRTSTDAGRGDDEEPAALDDVLDDGLSPTLLDRLAGAPSTAWTGRHRGALVRTATVFAAVVAVAVAAPSLRPAADGPGSWAPLIGVSIQVPPPRPDGAAPRPILATYRAPGAGVGVMVDGVVGPFLTASGTHVTSGVAGGGDPVFTVSAVPDCRDATRLDLTGTPYLVTVTRAGPDGRPIHGRVRVSGSPLDWGGAIRQDCWQREAAAGISVEMLHAGRQRASHQLLLTVRLRSALRRDVQVGVVDIANVAAVDASESGTVTTGQTRVFHVRLPVAGCPATGLPDAADRSGPGSAQARSSLMWSVGPVGGDAAALFVTRLTAGQRSTIRESLDGLCASTSRSAPSP